MNPAQLLSHFDRISEAPDAIPRLRRFILDLAVRGKLTRQDRKDESASLLLKRIEEERQRLITEGKIREQNLIAAVEIDEQPFELPTNWRWVRFGGIAHFSAGKTPARHDLSLWNTGEYPWVSIADMKDGGEVSSTKETISEKAKKQVFGSEPAPVGTMIMSFKLTIGKISLLGVPAFHNEAIISFSPYLREMNTYLFKVLPVFARQGDTKDAVKGATLNRESIANIFLPLPPVAEQHRIVAKIDELTRTFIQLEAIQQERQSRRDQLSDSCFHHLKNTEDPASLRTTASFYLNHLPQLTSCPEQLTSVRQTVLNLAVRGQLVPQDRNDEAASSLQERMAAEIRKYAREHDIVPSKAEPIEPDSVPYPAPKGWVWTRLCCIFKIITDGDHQPPPKSESGVAFLTIGNITTGSIDFSNCRYVDQSYLESVAEYRKPAFGDVLYTVVGATYGRPVLVDTKRPFCVQRHIAILKPTSEIDIKFLRFLMASPLIYDQATRGATGAAQPTVALKPLRNFLVPLPPLAEQRRILARVEELMALCDSLEAQLVVTQTETSFLLESVLHHALGSETLSLASDSALQAS